MSVELETRMKAIQGKLQQVLKHYAAIQRENSRLKKELSAGKSEIKGQQDRLAALQQQVDIMKMGVSKWSVEEKAELEKRIDVYLKEIDKCLALLNN
ncbi:MAG TPA: hypothetical protein VF145_07355 [Chitinophagaceae bacterium]